MAEEVTLEISTTKEISSINIILIKTTKTIVSIILQAIPCNLVNHLNSKKAIQIPMHRIFSHPFPSIFSILQVITIEIFTITIKMMLMKKMMTIMTNMMNMISHVKNNIMAMKIMMMTKKRIRMKMMEKMKMQWMMKTMVMNRVSTIKVSHNNIVIARVKI